MAAGKEMQIAIKIAGKVEESFKSAIGHAGQGIKSVAKAAAAASIAAAVAVGGMGVAAINVGREFEGAMSQVQATMLLDKSTEEGRKSLETLENAARECGATTAFTATQAAEALNYLALAGYDAEKAATALPTVLRLAGAGAMDLAAASDMITDSMAALGIEATEANLTSFADQMAQTASKANTNVAQLGEAILTVGGTAKDLKGGTTELNAALGILADVGIKGSEGGTKLRNVIMSLTAPTDKAQDALNSLGITAFDSEGNMRGLDETLGDMNNAMKNLTVQEQKEWLNTVFNKQDLAAVSGLLAATSSEASNLAGLLFAGYDFYVDTETIEHFKNVMQETDGATKLAQEIMDEYGFGMQEAAEIAGIVGSSLDGNISRFEELTGVIEDSAGACENMYGIQLDNLNGDLAILQSGLEEVGIKVYKDLNGPLREMTQLGTSMVEKLGEAFQEGGMAGMVGAVGGCLSEVVGVISSYAPKVMSMGISLLSSFINGIAENSGALADSAAEVIGVFVEGLFALVPQIILAGIDIIMQFVQSITSRLPQLVNKGTQAITNFVSGIIQRLPQIISTAIKLVQTLVSSLGNNAPMLIGAAIQLIGSLVLGIVQMLPSILQIGIQLIMSLVQGIIANLPLLLQMAVQIILNLVNGLSQMFPMLIQSGIQLIITLLQGIIGNLGNIVQAAIQIVLAIVTGLIQAIPQLMMAGYQLIFAVVDTIMTTDWLQIGKDILNGIKEGVLSMAKDLGHSVKNAVLDFFGFGGESGTDNTSQAALAGQTITSSYAGGIIGSAAAASEAANSLSTEAFSDMDLSGVSAAGTGAGEAYTASLTESMEGFTFDFSGMGLDASLTDSMGTAGLNGITALETGIGDNTGLVINAMSSMGGDINTTLDASWSTAESNAKTAMDNMTQTVKTAAQAAANAVKAAFENLTIKIPKPKIPVINVAYSTENYGDGGSVKIPKFDVAWNALGGIFTKPTILGSSAGAQGVGEAGSEAILPLDTLWTQMRRIVGQVVRENSGASVIDALIAKLQGMGGGGGIGGQPQLAGAGGPNFTYSPTYNLYGSAGKQEIQEADKLSRAEFNKMMKQWRKDNDRTKF
ncbi:MAG: phage tail tape measure protein [Lachnospiraceae bacterium]